MANSKEIESVLGSNEYALKGNTYVVYTNDDRVPYLKKLADRIKGARYSPTGASSVGEVRFQNFKVLAKKPKGSGGGSGAGAYVTALAESGQCYYCAAAWYGKDFTDATLRNTAKYVEADIGVEEVIKNLPDHWIDSCASSAKVLKSYLGSKRFRFHRGSLLVKQLVDVFNVLNKRQKFFSNINKWSPADIWLVSEGTKLTFDFEDFNGLNAFLLKSAKSKDFIGVSLKQAKNPSITQVNYNKDRHAYKYLDATLGKRDFFESKDVYLFFDEGEIQFRGFPTWQGEIKGKTANHGKVSGGPVKNIVEKFVNEKLDTQQVIEGYIKTKNKNFYKKFYEYYSKLVTKGVKFDEFFQIVSKKDLNWQSSKYLGTQLVYVMKTSRNRQIILSSIINYAKSQSDFSAPHLKVH